MNTYNITYRVGDEEYSDYVAASNKEEARKVFLQKCQYANPVIIYVTEV